VLERLESSLLNLDFRFWILELAASSLLCGCLNPFAPVQGEVGTQSWSDQKTVGGLLRNFSLAYDYRDSLRYADCLDESFVFHFYDVDAGRFDSWYRDTDLKATGGLFRNYDRLDLEWNLIPDDVVNFSLPDSLLSFIVRFNLTLGEDSPLMGYAHFSVQMGADKRFRVVTWSDDF
jgi:hypothetical protein